MSWDIPPIQDARVHQRNPPESPESSKVPLVKVTSAAKVSMKKPRVVQLHDCFPKKGVGFTTQFIVKRQVRT